MSERSSQNAESQISELKVSAHTMSLEPGMYCVFNAPGSTAAEPDSGLPAVRITAAPGFRGGAITVVGFNHDGWIGPDAATLVRVTGEQARLLVTVYQGKGSQAEAPQLQVVRLSGGAVPEAAAAPAKAAAKVPAKQAANADASKASHDAAKKEGVEVVAHVYGRGDQGSLLGNWIGEPGSNRWIEGFGVLPLNGVPAADLEYQAVLGRGWLSPWSAGGDFCGSRGMSLPILGLRVRLRGKSAATHRVALSASFVDGTKVGPVGDGEACEAPSLAALEAFNLSMQPVGTKVTAAKMPKAAPAKAAAKVIAAPVAKRAAAKPVPAKVAPKPVAKAAPKAVAPKPVAKAVAPKPVAKKAVAPKAAVAKPVVPKPVVPKPAAKRTPPSTRRR